MMSSLTTTIIILVTMRLLIRVREDNFYSFLPAAHLHNNWISPLLVLVIIQMDFPTTFSRRWLLVEFEADNHPPLEQQGSKKTLEKAKLN